MLDCVDQLSTPSAAAAAAMCSGLDVTDTVHERSGSTTVNKKDYFTLCISTFHYSANFTGGLFAIYVILACEIFSLHAD